MLQNLVPDTPYNITVEAVYPEGPGGTLTGPGRTGGISLAEILSPEIR